MLWERGGGEGAEGGQVDSARFIRHLLTKKERRISRVWVGG